MRSRWWVWALAVVVLVLVLTAGSSVALARMTRSSSASKLHIPNTPDTPEDKKRLLWLDHRRAEVERELRRQFPGMRLTSAYRNERVNAAVDGAPGSRHRHGLAIDFGDGSSDYRPHARFLRAAARALSVRPSMVIAETHPPHLHIDYADPLGILDEHREAPATAWREERGDRAAGQKRNLVELT